MEAALSDSLLHADGWIDASRTLAALRDPGLSTDTARQLWYILVAERWLRAERDDVAGTVPLERVALSISG